MRPPFGYFSAEFEAIKNLKLSQTPSPDFLYFRVFTLSNLYCEPSDENFYLVFEAMFCASSVLLIACL